MIGIILLLIVFYWLLLGAKQGLTAKIIVALSIFAVCIYFLHLQGANREQILEILFSFP